MVSKKRKTTKKTGKWSGFIR